MILNVKTTYLIWLCLCVVCDAIIKTSKPSFKKPRRRCGSPIVGKGTLYGGAKFSRGDLPWMVPLFDITGKETEPFKYFCGGTIISTRNILSGESPILT